MADVMSAASTPLMGCRIYASGRDAHSLRVLGALSSLQQDRWLLKQAARLMSNTRRMLHTGT